VIGPYRTLKKLKAGEAVVAEEESAGDDDEDDSGGVEVRLD